ncbi:ABC transporter ATP-binding protein [Eggerthellaceae bacterium zg-1084]|uniref:energy-coupling factor ABC transporter ATP-binding protein n=1 Tax=Berryella wangjianweii TaxID=2734634 RepID=UPI001553DAAD|nr:ABC transporter ATP-binding protein [Berryella wangjianweii]NPD30821.1 ABC transporter ATP-binding protein [Berryella wangjianweii]
MIEFQNVRASYGAREALQGVSFRIAPGELVALVGTNGAGKSTAMRMVNGLVRPTGGRVMVGGVDAGRAKVSQLARTVGFLFQNPDRQICCSTVRDELLFGLRACGADDEEAARRVDDAIERFGFRADADPFLLNRGARQMLALAAVTVLHPAVLVLDEPTTGLDFRECERVMEVVGRLSAAGCTVMMVCHDMEVVADHAPRTIVLHEGRVLADGPTFQVLRDRDVMQRASLVPPQVVAISQQMARDLPQVADGPVGCANTVDQLVDAVACAAASSLGARRCADARTGPGSSAGCADRVFEQGKEGLR